jgi:predicted NUDIX family phosphoesterase
MSPNEKVLVVKREKFEALGLPQGLSFEIDKYLDIIFAEGAAEFIDRPDAEKDPSYKQIIPYVIMGCKDTCLTYVRGKRAGEKRLVGNRSIGIGGHINPQDDMPLFGSLRDTYLTAVDREVEEEVNVKSKYTDSITAVLNDESNEVGKVHLGLVHYRQLETPSVTRNEQMITQLEFLPIHDLKKLSDTMETWSSICLAQLEKIQRL